MAFAEVGRISIFGSGARREGVDFSAAAQLLPQLGDRRQQGGVQVDPV